MYRDREGALAELLVDHSIGAEPGETVIIEFDYAARSLAGTVYGTLKERGADPVYRAPDTVDAAIQIQAPDGGEGNTVDTDETHAALGLDPAYETSDAFRWCFTRYPTRFRAEKAGMGMEAYEDFYYDAVLRDWDGLADRMMPVKERIDAGSEIRVLGEGTDLRMSIMEQEYVNIIAQVETGQFNLPDGEVFTCSRTVDGTIHFDRTVHKYGHDFGGVTLTFEDGDLTAYEAETGEDALRKAFETIEGAARVGEFGIGTNDQIDRFTRDPLFDEKIGGTIHLAMGSDYRDAYEITDSKGTEREQAEAELDTLRNPAEFHLDLVKDLRDGGTVLVDGEPVLKDGTLCM